MSACSAWPTRLAPILIVLVCLLPTAAIPAEDTPKTEESAAEIRNREAVPLLLKAINEHRATTEAPELKLNPELSSACATHAATMIALNEFSHQAGETTPGQRATAAGYFWARIAENIYWQGGFHSSSAQLPERTCQTWIKSPGHLQNLANPAYADCGIAIQTDPRTEKTYVVMKYGTKKALGARR